MGSERKTILKSIIDYDSSFHNSLKTILKYEWDSKEIIKITTSGIKSILRRYLDGNLSAEQVEEWANIIESRDDIGYEELSKDIMKQVIFKLANQSITEKLTCNDAEKMIKELTI